MWNLSTLTQPEDLAKLYQMAFKFSNRCNHRYYRIYDQLGKLGTETAKLEEAIALKNLAILSLEKIIIHSPMPSEFVMKKLSMAQAEMEKLQSSRLTDEALQRQILLFEMNLQKVRCETFDEFVGQIDASNKEKRTFSALKVPALDVSKLSAVEMEKFRKHFANAEQLSYIFFLSQRRKRVLVQERSGRFDNEMVNAIEMAEVFEQALKQPRIIAAPDYHEYVRMHLEYKDASRKYTKYHKAYNPVRGEFISATVEMGERIINVLKSVAAEHSLPLRYIG